MGLIMAIGVLLLWQLFLVLTGQTSIEFYYNKSQIQFAKRNGKVCFF